jgi:hypothetical protein
MTGTPGPPIAVSIRYRECRVRRAHCEIKELTPSQPAWLGLPYSWDGATDEIGYTIALDAKAPRRDKLGNLAAVAGCGARREEEQRSNAPATASKIDQVIPARCLTKRRPGFPQQKPALPQLLLSSVEMRRYQASLTPARETNARCIDHGKKTLSRRTSCLEPRTP